MGKRAYLGLLALAVLGTGCRSSLEKQGEVKPAPAQTPKPVATAPTPSAPVPSSSVTPAPAAAPAGAGYEVLKLTAQLPRSLVDDARARASCPATAFAMLFGAQLANPRGCILGALTPEGLAARAGLRAGDSIVACNGREVTCPSTFLPAVLAPKQPDTIELIIHRPTGLPGAGAASSPRGKGASPSSAP
jgi:hypothetical protein